jgi:hypothetical protein
MLVNSNLIQDEDEAIDVRNHEYVEQHVTHSNAYSTYAVYYKIVFGLFSPILILTLFAATQVLVMFADYWPLYW